MEICRYDFNASSNQLTTWKAALQHISVLSECGLMMDLESQQWVGDLDSLKFRSAAVIAIMASAYYFRSSLCQVGKLHE